MSIDFNSVFDDMVKSAGNAVEEGKEQFSEEMKKALLSNQVAIEELSQALMNGDIDQSEFEQELEREKQVLEAQLLGLEIQTKSQIQKAINAAMQVLTSAVTSAF